MSYPSVRRWLVEQTPLEPSLLDGAGFDTLITGRVAASGTGTEAGYVAMLDRSPDEVNQLVAGIAVPETWLFRYPRSFDLLVEFVARRLAEGRPSLRLCSIGCATGQEPYCMAMAALHAGWPAERISVDALDRNLEFLQLAAAGEYGPASIRTEVPDWALSYLHRRGERIHVDPAVRTMVRFTQADATGPGALSEIAPCDAIFCRNVLIYLNAEARARMLDSICKALAPGGLLFVGHAEQSIRGGRGSAPLRALPARHAFALERIDAAAAPSDSRPVVVGPRTIAFTRPAPTALPNLAPRRPDPEPEETIDDACALADAGSMQDAERSVRAIISRRGPSARAFELLGMIRLAANDAPGARRLFEQAVYLEPERPVSLLQLAIISERSGDSQRTAALWDRAHRAATSDGRERRP